MPAREIRVFGSVAAVAPLTRRRARIRHGHAFASAPVAPEG
jgi:hypothetical protein